MIKISTNQMDFQISSENDNLKQTFEIENLSQDKNLIFKIKSSNVDSYVVLPNTQQLEPSKTVKINVDIKGHKILLRRKKEIKD
jgi:hypothetical protein